MLTNFQISWQDIVHEPHISGTGTIYNTIEYVKVGVHCCHVPPTGHIVRRKLGQHFTMMHSCTPAKRPNKPSIAEAHIIAHPESVSTRSLLIWEVMIKSAQHIEISLQRENVQRKGGCNRGCSLPIEKGCVSHSAKISRLWRPHLCTSSPHNPGFLRYRDRNIIIHNCK